MQRRRRRPSPRNADRLHVGRQLIDRGPAPRRLRPPRRRLGPDLRRQREPDRREPQRRHARPARPRARQLRRDARRHRPQCEPRRGRARPATSSTGAASPTSTRPSTASGCFIAGGVFGGTLLASLAGLAIAAPGDAADLLADRDRARDRRHRRPLPPHAARRRPTTRSASWPGRWSRCCARSTPPAPSARRR